MALRERILSHLRDDNRAGAAAVDEGIPIPGGASRAMRCRDGSGARPTGVNRRVRQSLKGIEMRLVCHMFISAATAIALSAAAAAADRSPDQTAPQTVPQAPPEQHSGSSLSGRLDQTNGVIRPPSGVDPGAV